MWMKVLCLDYRIDILNFLFIIDQIIHEKCKHVLIFAFIMKGRPQHQRSWMSIKLLLKNYYSTFIFSVKKIF